MFVFFGRTRRILLNPPTNIKNIFEKLHNMCKKSFMFVPMKKKNRRRGHFMIESDQFDAVHDPNVQDRFKVRTASALVRKAIDKLLGK